MGNELSVEERNLISVGYKNMMSVRRTAFRTVHHDLAPVAEDVGDNFPVRLSEYEATIAHEVFALIEEVVEQIVKPYAEGNLKSADDDEVIVFFKKMEGDY